MKRLFSIEFQKIWMNRSSRILLISYFIILSFIALIASLKIEIGSFNMRLADQGIFNFPYIWHFNTYIAAVLKLFLAIVIVSMMANEYSYGTLKQNLIDGLSKKEFVLSKFYTVVAMALASTVYVFLLSLILGLSFSSYDETSIIFTDLQFIAAYFLKLTAFFSFCLFLGILVKRSAFALGFLLVWNIFEGIVFAILRVGFFADSPDTARSVMRFLPLESMANLIKEPFTRLSLIKQIETSIGGAANAKIYDVQFVDVVIVLAWTVIFVLMSYTILKKRDL